MLRFVRYIVLAATVRVATGLEPLKMTYHEAAKPGERVGLQIPDSSLLRALPSHQRKLLTATQTVGSVGLTAVSATTSQTGGGQGWIQTSKVRSRCEPGPSVEPL